MLTLFLAYLDQFRAVAGLILAFFLFSRHVAPRREKFAFRITAWSVLCIALGLAYVPLEPVIAQFPTVLYGAASALYWITLTLLISFTVYRCYELSPSDTVFRALLGCALEGIVTTVLRYLIVMMWLPDLPEQSPASYILLCLTVYIVFYCTAYRFLARRLQREGTTVEETLGPLRICLLILLMFLLIMYSTNGVCEWLIPALENKVGVHPEFDLIRYFCVGIRLLVCIAYLTSQYFVYETKTLQNERDLVRHLLKEKTAQYEFNLENIEFIRRKSHDLKRQLRALELASDAERKAVIEETRRAAEFYDATVHTGHEVLDTLLTEKNLLCTNRNIRLSCIVNINNIDHIGTVDLYTMLSNALDNAIEGVEQVPEPGMKTIRFSMEERGGILCIEVENYYAGTIQLHGGLPVTSKADSLNHGIGVMSIRTLAQRYGGDIEINIEDQTFLLQIAIPLSE